MRPLEIAKAYTLADKRFYEPIGRLALGDDLAGLLGELGADLATEGIWAICRPPQSAPLPEHGWKIHVSATPTNAAAVVRAVCAEFRAAPFVFKVLRDSRFVITTSARWWPRGSAGKLITVYPRSAEDCRALLSRLDDALGASEGPYILSDQRYGQSRCLFYRYGGFRLTTRLRPDGRAEPVLLGPEGQIWADDRAPVYQTPPWVPELFPEPQPPGSGSDGGPVIGGYLVRSAIRLSNAGGVYVAEVPETGTQVILKEARPYAEYSHGRVDAPTRLRREFEALTSLRDTGIAPVPLGLFQEWEHLFLVQERIEGVSLLAFVAENNPLVQGDRSRGALRAYREKARVVLNNVEKALHTCHEHGFAHGDLSWTNILVDTETLNVRLIDFEASRSLDDRSDGHPLTPGFSPPAGSPSRRSGAAVDRVALAAVEATLIFPWNALVELDPRAFVQGSRHAARILDVPNNDVYQRMELPADAIGPTDGQAPQLPLHALLTEAINDGVRFILGTADIGRRDRLFPGDHQLFVTSPWNLAFGGAGVLRALRRLTGEVPDELVNRFIRGLPEPDTMPPGLHYGWAGVAVALIELDAVELGSTILDRALAGCEHLPADIATGLSGVGTAMLNAWWMTGEEQFRRGALNIGAMLMKRANDDGGGIFWQGEDASSVGFAYGSSGVATFLLRLYQVSDDRRFLRLGRRALQRDLGEAVRRDNGGLDFPLKVGKPGSQPYWTRGSAGVGAATIRYYRATGEEQLQEVLTGLVPSTLSVLAVNIGLFNGMAGLVDLAADFTQTLDPSYRSHASSLVRGIVSLTSTQPEGLAFPGDSMLRYSCDFATGSAGILLAFDRVLRGGPSANFMLDELETTAPRGMS